jgi:V/A-type H+/Na+-transporting ATPase subunit I
MFKPAAMARLHVVILEQDERAVLRNLGTLGAVQLTTVRSGPDTAPLAPRDRTREIARCDRVRTRVEELRRSLEIVPPYGLGQAMEMSLDDAEESLHSMEDRATALLEQRQDLLQHQRELATIKDRVSPYRGLDLPLDHPDTYSFLHFVTGTLPTQNLEGLENNLPENATVLPLTEKKGRRSLVAVTSRQGRAALENALQEAGFQRELLPSMEGTTVDTLFGERGSEQEAVVVRLQEVNEKIRALAAEIGQPLAGIDEMVGTECRLLEAAQKFPRTEAAVLLAGWVPSEDVPAIEHSVARITRGRYALETTSPGDTAEEPVPVLLRHHRLLRPFGMLVSTYGLPSYSELEPTLFVAVSYILMFGIMFGDAGHGAVLALLGLIGLRLGRSDQARDVGLLLLFGGSASIISGMVYGSYFGIEGLKKYALWHDPLEGNPIALMYGAIGLGVVMISLGLVLNIINRFRRGDVIGGFLDKFGLVGLLFYWGTLVLLISGETIRARGLMNVAIALFLVLPLIGWAVKEPMEHFLHHARGHHSDSGGGLASAFVESFVGAFEAVLSYLANTISFVRLAAYAMSHAALLVAAFMLAEQVRHFSFGGSVWSLVVIILGNVVAIVLEGIIASVQALRLEYYEFFGKFFSGSGQPFEPFRLAGEDRPSAM